MITIQNTKVPQLYNKDSSKKDKKTCGPELHRRPLPGGGFPGEQRCFSMSSIAGQVDSGTQTRKGSGHRGAWLGLPGSLTERPQRVARSAPRTAPGPAHALCTWGLLAFADLRVPNAQAGSPTPRWVLSHASRSPGARTEDGGGLASAVPQRLPRSSPKGHRLRSNARFKSSVTHSEEKGGAESLSPRPPHTRRHAAAATPALCRHGSQTGRLAGFL